MVDGAVSARGEGEVWIILGVCGVMMGPASSSPELPLRTIVLSLRENENASQVDVNASVSVHVGLPVGVRSRRFPLGLCYSLHILQLP